MSEPHVVLEMLDLEIEDLQGRLNSLTEARETLSSLLPSSPAKSARAPRRKARKPKVSRRSAKTRKPNRRNLIARSASRMKKGGALGTCGSDAEGHGGELRHVTCIVCGTHFVRCANHNRARGSVKALLDAHKRVCGEEES